MGAVFGAGEGTGQILKEMESTKRIGKMIMKGSFWQDGKRIGEAGFVDHTAAALGRIQTAEGHLPSDGTEIAVTETVAGRLKERVKIGDKIELALSENGEMESYTLSGIVKPWGREWTTEKYELPSVILGMDGTVQGETYLFFESDSTDELNHIQARLETLGEGTYVYNEKAYPLDISVLDEFFLEGKYIFFIVLISAILICYLMMLTLKSRRYSLTVLRGIGADAAEVIQLVLWETTFLWGGGVSCRRGNERNHDRCCAVYGTYYCENSGSFYNPGRVHTRIHNVCDRDLFYVQSCRRVDGDLVTDTHHL